ncbi:BQ5605_C033g11218 [Microbotryum silenes-dioicae]|uniref:BQ5605_C033g11218 protein n=1 Tax=Microbotryum silenes-dioicae TaxID=796604 RepID=A0A2X0PBG9_9BASI|nr:BQ5605_C033g11218 [Microbotryum silenes-dioicae]
MYQHTVVSAAPACGDHVPIRSHKKPSPLCPGPKVVATDGSAVPWAFLALRHVYEPAVQLCRTDSVVSAMANSTLGSPHHHLRKGECAGLESRSNPSSPTFSQGKVRLPPPPQPNLEYRQLLEGLDSDAKAFRENARSYNNALSFTSLAAHWDQTQVGTLGPPVFRVFGRLYHRLGALIPAVNQRPAFAQTWLIDPAEATDTRLQGPDSAGTRIQRSTLTKLESMLRTGNRFVREFASAKARAGWDTAKEWVLRLCLPAGRDRRTHNLPTSSTEMAMIICDSDINTGDRGPQDLILQVHGDRCPDGRPKYQVGEMAFTPTFPFAGSTKLGHSLPKDRDEEEGDAENGDGEPQIKGIEVTSLAFTIISVRLAQTRRVLLNPALHPTWLPGVRNDGYSQVETDRLNLPPVGLRKGLGFKTDFKHLCQPTNLYWAYFTTCVKRVFRPTMSLKNWPS